MTGVTIDPTDAQRLARLRSLLVDARRRVNDESELGIHLATIAIDGIGELGIGLCLEHCGIQPKQKVGLPGRLSQLLEALDFTPPGLKAFGELHRVRNLVQHAGVLPSADQLPRWLSETEAMIDALVKATFGIGLSEVGASGGVKDGELRDKLEEAEGKLEKGEAEDSFDASWHGLESARRKFRQETGLSPRTGSAGAARKLERLDRNLGQLSADVLSLADQIELSAFTAEPGEWLWLRQRQAERFRGLPITLADAMRAFAFVLGWVLWFESYISRHNVDRWERWQEEQRPPITGVPGGPHISDVSIGDNPGAPGGRTENLRQWVFQLTDVPETQPTFDWAVFTALDQLENSPLTAAYLNADGRLHVSCDVELEPTVVKAAVIELIEKAETILRGRKAEEDEDAQKEADILRHFQQGLQGVGCAAVEIRLHRSDRGYRVDPVESLVWIELERPSDGNQSWFSKGLEESFERHFPEYVEAGSSSPTSYRSMWHDVGVPITWDPKRVGIWVAEAAEYDQERRAEQQQERDRRDDAANRAVAEMKKLVRLSDEDD